MGEVQRWRRSNELLGSKPVSAISFAFSRSEFRVLGYHGIIDVEGFRTQMEWVADQCNPVSASQVVGALSGTVRLPKRPVWVTFDDGDPSVVDQGIPVLAATGIPATMFVCPGVVDTKEPYWWQVIETGVELGIALQGQVLTRADIARAKTLPDGARRAMVQRLRNRIELISGNRLATPQVTTRELRRWVQSGHSIGNHTWDHPLLHRCGPEEQGSQITRAHEWIDAHFRSEPLLFAYPNGDWAQESEVLLKSLGYKGGVLFDHRLSNLRHPLRVSRLRTNADADLTRFRATLSGAHPAVHRVRAGLQKRRR